MTPAPQGQQLFLLIINSTVLTQKKNPHLYYKFLVFSMLAIIFKEKDLTIFPTIFPLLSYSLEVNPFRLYQFMFTL